MLAQPNMIMQKIWIYVFSLNHHDSSRDGRERGREIVQFRRDASVKSHHSVVHHAAWYHLCVHISSMFIDAFFCFSVLGLTEEKTSIEINGLRQKKICIKFYIRKGGEWELTCSITYFILPDTSYTQSFAWFSVSRSPQYCLYNHSGSDVSILNFFCFLPEL